MQDATTHRCAVDMQGENDCYWLLWNSIDVCNCFFYCLITEGRRFGRTVMTLRICDIEEHNSEDEEENDTVNIPKPKRHCTATQMISVNINR